MSHIIKGQVVILVALFSALVLTLVACGGGSSSAGAGGVSGSTVRGTVDSGLAASGHSERSWALAVVDVLVERADAAGVADVTVQLVNSSNVVVATTTTDGNGRFVFNNVAAGDYTIRLLQGGSVVGETSSVSVGASTNTEIELSLAGDVLSIEVEAGDGQVSGSVEDDLSSDGDDSSGDGASLDGDSTDDDPDDDSTNDSNSNDDDNNSGG